jgi:hypothetical protein
MPAVILMQSFSGNFIKIYNRCHFVPEQNFIFGLIQCDKRLSLIVNAASAEGKSLNQWVVDALDQAAHIYA